jgi:predicted signal transduction protein with EAL and GGDEF domain
MPAGQCRVAINVSAQQFIAGDFLAEIERLLKRLDLPPDSLELELTENMLQTGAITVETLHSLQLLGVSTALDDFGTGYSSLTSLERLPLSRVKLDRSVVAEVDWSCAPPRSRSITRLPQPQPAGDGRGVNARVARFQLRRLSCGLPGRTSGAEVLGP